MDDVSTRVYVLNLFSECGNEEKEEKLKTKHFSSYEYYLLNRPPRWSSKSKLRC